MKPPPNIYAKSRKRRVVRFCVKLFAMGVITVVAFGFLFIKYIEFTSDIPLPNAKNGPVKPSLIVDIRGRTIDKIGQERNIIPLDQIPKHLQLAAMAAEDKDFYSHSGFSYPAILRAMLVNVQAGDLNKQGGSTITQQYAKVAFLEHGRTVERKYKEMILAGQIEKQMTKDQIMAAYLNTIYFGNGADGVDEAARILFGKPVGQLTLADSAYLAGAIRSPETYANTKNAESALKRRNHILDVMLEEKWITAAEHTEAIKAPLNLKPKPTEAAQSSSPYPDIELKVRQILEAKGYGGLTGLKIITTIDLDMQRAAEAALAGINPQGPQAALVAIDPGSGGIRVWHASVQKKKLNSVLRAPGSTMKPFVVAAALKNDIPLEQPLDAPACYLQDSLCNYDKKDHGKVTLIDSTIRSLNTPFAQLLDKKSPLEKTVSPKQVRQLAMNAGLDDKLVDEDPAPKLEADLRIPLGGGGVSTLQLASAYATLANGGEHFQPYLVAEVRTAEDRVIVHHTPKASREIAQEDAAHVSWLLSRALKEGTGRNAFFGKPAAGKTGTSSDYVDARFTGYISSLVASVWMGNINNDPMNEITGGSQPAAIWKSFMSKAAGGMPANEFARPVEAPPETTTSSSSSTTSSTTTTTEPEIEVTIPDVEDTVDEVLAPDASTDSAGKAATVGQAATGASGGATTTTAPPAAQPATTTSTAPPAAQPAPTTTAPPTTIASPPG